MNDNDEIPLLAPMPDDVEAGRSPGWQLDRLVHRACPVCSVDAPRPLCRRPDRLVVAVCTACGMTYLPAIPNEQDLQSFYGRYDEFKTGLRERTRWWNTFLPPPHNPYLEILERMGGLEGKRLCEIGCASGAFLLLARRAGALVSGVELDEKARATLERRGLPAASQLDPDQRFDIVCAFELIEHLARPGDWIADVSRTLVPDGRLLLALPNGGEVESVGPGWVGFRVDLEHLNYFSVGTLARLLRRSGIYVEHFWELRQPNVARTREASHAGSLWARATARVTGQPATPWCQREGTFGLTLLARKAAD